MSLYLKVRPTDFDGVVGQDHILSKLRKFLKQNSLPQVLLLHGHTGTGKTTLARILASKLGVDGSDLTEMNCADCRGIDDVREIADHMRYAGLNKSRRRVWILDEVVQLPKTTQKAMLKMLEDTPKHVYFFLCTTDKDDLLDTIQGRCHQLAFKSLSKMSITRLVSQVAKIEKKPIEDIVISKIADLADGSARHALQLLEGALTADTPEEQIKTMEAVDGETQAHQLAQALVFNKGWPRVSEIISKFKGDPHKARWTVMAYCNSVILGSSQPIHKQKASLVLAEFSRGWDDCGKYGMTGCSWRICYGKS